MQIGIGFSVERDHIKAVKEAVEKAKINISREKVDLVLVFNTINFNHPLVLSTISELLNNAPLLGLSSPAVMHNQGVSNNGLLIILFSFSEETYFNTACVKEISVKGAHASGEKLGEELLYGCKGIRRNLSIVFSDGYIPEGQKITLGIQNKVGRSFPIIGASSSAKNTGEGKTCLYHNAFSLNDAACGILLGGKLGFGLGIKHGWQPLGKPRKVTRSLGNVVNEIDNKPAVNLYEEYFNKDLNGIKKEINRISSLYPLGISVDRENEYLLRSLTSILNDGSLFLNGEVPEGSAVRLMISSRSSCLKSTKEAAYAAKNNLGNQEAKIILIFNSSARASILGRERNMEIEEILKVFGKDAPMAGVYTAAEYAPFSDDDYLGRSYFHNNSIAVLAITG
jgi:hypothetical protein